MGVVLRFPDPGSRPDRDPGSDDQAPSWAVPGVDPAGGFPVDVDADAPVTVPARAAGRAANVSLAALTSRDTTEAELRARLTRKGLDETDVDAELQRLRSTGLVDDQAFAARFIERLRERKGLGDAALRLELRQRQVPAAVADAAIAAASEDSETVQERIHEVAGQRARRLGGLAPDVAERRLIAYLQRKGYSGADARAAARAALGDH